MAWSRPGGRPSRGRTARFREAQREARRSSPSRTGDRARIACGWRARQLFADAARPRIRTVTSLSPPVRDRRDQCISGCSQNECPITIVRNCPQLGDLRHQPHLLLAFDGGVERSRRPPVVRLDHVIGGAEPDRFDNCRGRSGPTASRPAGRLSHFSARTSRSVQPDHTSSRTRPVDRLFDGASISSPRSRAGPYPQRGTSAGN